ncbi:hypothetical protein Tco_0547520 [Tanacetum coccineum]
MKRFCCETQVADAQAEQRLESLSQRACRRKKWHCLSGGKNNPLLGLDEFSPESEERWMKQEGEWLISHGPAPLRHGRLESQEVMHPLGIEYSVEKSPLEDPRPIRRAKKRGERQGNIMRWYVAAHIPRSDEYQLSVATVSPKIVNFWEAEES